jgi:hypothetical protein
MRRIVLFFLHGSFRHRSLTQLLLPFRFELEFTKIFVIENLLPSIGDVGCQLCVSQTSSIIQYHQKTSLLMVLYGKYKLKEMKTNLKDTVERIQEKTKSQNSWETVSLRLD